MLRALWHHYALRQARAQLASRDHAIVGDQIAISEIAAPTGEENERAQWVARRFEALELSDVRIDQVGNVIGRRRGRTDGPPVLVCAHLDTVFPRQTRVSVTRLGNRLAGPGIGDNGRGVAAMLAIATVVDGLTLRTDRPIDFIGTTGEEGAGDLRGAKHLFGHEGRDAAAAVILDGAGDERIVHRALASRRYRLSFQGPGGHSWTAFGVPNAVHAAAVATARLARITLPTNPRTTLSVGRIGGGISVNSIPDHAWLEVDVRSASAAMIARLDREVREAATAGALEENARRAAGAIPLTYGIEVIGERPGGETPVDHPLVLATMEATRLIGRNPELAIASTDANIPISLGIPAVAIGAGGRGGDAHTPGEWFENTEGTLGLSRALGVVVEAAGLVD
ncbi:MAG TPA: M20/M25/M40 family metallo-hydrolase [Gemmatimonadaceae bacterium]|nr:M20/M25/M40 family metallo-hydrolase [Gemmatimonadaceae bacterium]